MRCSHPEHARTLLFTTILFVLSFTATLAESANVHGFRAHHAWRRRAPLDVIARDQVLPLTTPSQSLLSSITSAMSPVTVPSVTTSLPPIPALQSPTSNPFPIPPTNPLATTSSSSSPTPPSVPTSTSTTSAAMPTTSNGTPVSLPPLLNRIPLLNLPLNLPGLRPHPGPRPRPQHLLSLQQRRLHNR
ncbi:hypothetical protein BDR06DRAFT_544910 [Suillus hirtellus]|nr:hypothetical protein BDR06DRAFT_544910 [Suillus hirtellus]